MDVAGGVSPRVSPFAEIKDAGGLLQRAGFALPVVDSDVITVTYSDAFALMRELRGHGRDQRRAGAAQGAGPPAACCSTPPGAMPSSMPSRTGGFR